MSIHKPVLLKETIEYLNLKEGDIVVDATLGGAGHSEFALSKIGETGKLIAFDVDKDAIERFEFKIQNSKLKIKERIFLINDNFVNLDKVLANLKIEKVDAILADLGFSSDQLEDERIGMSFMVDAPLDMRLDKVKEISAKTVVNEYSQENLERIIKEYGEEKWAGKIAKKILEIRETAEISTTKQLAEIIENAVPRKFWPRGKHAATRTFQAIRIEVNSELDNLRKFIPSAIEVLKPRGRLAIISFHSLEDRIVKEKFRENAGGCICPPDFPECRCGVVPKIKIITKKPIIPTEKEVGFNPRARSAKLRVCEKIQK